MTSERTYSPASIPQRRKVRRTPRPSRRRFRTARVPSCRRRCGSRWKPSPVRRLRVWKGRRSAQDLLLGSAAPCSRYAPLLLLPSLPFRRREGQRSTHRGHRCTPFSAMFSRSWTEVGSPSPEGDPVRPPPRPSPPLLGAWSTERHERSINVSAPPAQRTGSAAEERTVGGLAEPSISSMCSSSIRRSGAFGTASRGSSAVPSGVERVLDLVGDPRVISPAPELPRGSICASISAAPRGLSQADRQPFLLLPFAVLRSTSSPPRPPRRRLAHTAAQSAPHRYKRAEQPPGNFAAERIGDAYQNAPQRSSSRPREPAGAVAGRATSGLLRQQGAAVDLLA